MQTFSVVFLNCLVHSGIAARWVMPRLMGVYRDAATCRELLAWFKNVPDEGNVTVEARHNLFRFGAARKGSF